LAYRSSKRVIDFARQGGRSERDKLDRRRSTMLTIPPSFDARPLVYHSDRQALSTARFRRAGQLASADSRIYRDRRRLRSIQADSHMSLRLGHMTRCWHTDSVAHNQLHSNRQHSLSTTALIHRPTGAIGIQDV